MSDIWKVLIVIGGLFAWLTPLFLISEEKHRKDKKIKRLEQKLKDYKTKKQDGI